MTPTSIRQCSRALPLGVSVLAVLACGGGSPPSGVDDSIDGPGGMRDLRDTGGAATPKPVTATEAAGADCPPGLAISAGWPGEWPGPVVYVNAPVELAGRSSPCSATADVTCSVPAGLYHPWSGTADVEYLSVLAIQRFEVTSDLTLEGTKVPKGETIEIHQYLGEGFCQWVVDGNSYPDMCPEMLEEGAVKKLGEPLDFETRQVFGVGCTGGGRAWIENNEALFASPAVELGEFTDWGTAAKPGSGGWN